jgi:hypothetical protein
MAGNLIGDGGRPASVYFELRQQWHGIRPRITNESKTVRAIQDGETPSASYPKRDETGNI